MSSRDTTAPLHGPGRSTDPSNAVPGPGIPRSGDPAASTIMLGSSPGDLVAAVPALLGFTPAESVVLIGLSVPPPEVLPATDRTDGTVTRFCIGPVVRADLGTGAGAAAAAAMGRGVSDLPGAEVVCVVVTGDADDVHLPGPDDDPGATPAGGGRADVVSADVAAVTATLATFAVDVTAVYAVPGVWAGAPWREVTEAGEVGDSGTVPDPAQNAYGRFRASTGRRVMDSREEVDRALDARRPGDGPWTWRPRRGGGAATGDGDAGAGPLGRLRSLGVVLDAAAAVTQGDDPAGTLSAVRVRQALADAVMRLDMLPLTVLLAYSAHSPAAGELLAEAVRASSGALRRRFLTVLAFHRCATADGPAGLRAAARAVREVVDGPGGPDDRVTVALARALADSYAGGRLHEIVDILAESAVEVLEGMRLDLWADHGVGAGSCAGADGEDDVEAAAAAGDVLDRLTDDIDWAAVTAARRGGGRRGPR
ncbi:DUF4192 family protein [Corynebacterium bovis]|uniref:DUF4192 domain-containing protein n=4 Tax=Corynebacterium bovis TaxID=36808 RepID=A0A8H9Y907_9CORY|nr:DUF4192 family protein [Corynebacterium bovis]MBB3116540.1 hypothetical protein [Corynebacterium bovis DSM 20582 = CIP 54.80]QQC47699.1 DUF4192 family protein [Corynebacterium bovis]